MFWALQGAGGGGRLAAPPGRDGRAVIRRTGGQTIREFSEGAAALLPLGSGGAACSDATCLQARNGNGCREGIHAEQPALLK